MGESVAKRGVACLIEGGKPVVEEVARWGVGDEAHLIAVAGKANQDRGVNGTDVVALAGGDGSVGGITEDDGVDLVWIVFVVVGGGRGCGVGGTSGVGAVGIVVCTSVVTQGIEDRGESNDRSNGSEQDGFGAKRLASDEIEARSGERRDFRRQGLLHVDGPWVSVGRYC